ncbi:MAG: hypothetical protein ABIQ31_15825 [Ferruginibacter sp.]
MLFPSWLHDYDRQGVLEETESILDRLDALRYKLDSINFVGSKRYEDDGALAACKSAMRKYQRDVYKLAGDLTVDFNGREKAFEFPDFSGNGNKWQLARLKIDSDGNSHLVEEIEKKHFEPYWKRFGRKQ